MLPVVLLWACPAVLSAFDARIPTTQPQEMNDRQLASAAGLLGDPSYKVRQAVSVWLEQLPDDQLGRLAPIYRRTTDPEVRTRLRLAANDIFVAARQAGRRPQGFLGITHVQDSMVSPADGGMIDCVSVREVWPDSPAAAAGFKAGDVVVKINGKPVAPQEEGGFAAQVRVIKPGEDVAFTVVRDGKREELKAKLSSRRQFNIVDDDSGIWQEQFEQYFRKTFEQPDASGPRAEAPVGRPGQAGARLFGPDGVKRDFVIVDVRDLGLIAPVRDEPLEP
ncbi:MAG: hypothetical protein BIFFINMI_02894 [Phycisphaerae bacterium]|nr:hypothetical protein [Phycisphaerae bacterium]